jgi:beta-1,4-glucosyltransferase
MERTIAGFRVRNTTTGASIRFLQTRINRRSTTTVLFANANFITQCYLLRSLITSRKDIYIFNDGLAIDVACWFRYGSAFRDNLNGTDLVPTLLSRLSTPTRVFLVGGTDNVIQTASSIFGRYENVEIVGSIDGYSMWDDEASVIRLINKARPDIVLVGLGNPLQEQWILENRSSVDAPIMMGVGALFEFVSGNKPRAPETIRKLRLEWAHRLFLEPRRLAGRYTLGMAKFFAIAFLSGNKA